MHYDKAEGDIRKEFENFINVQNQLSKSNTSNITYGTQANNTSQMGTKSMVDKEPKKGNFGLNY